MENQSPFRVTSEEDKGAFGKEVPVKDELFCQHCGNGFLAAVHIQLGVIVSQRRADCSLLHFLKAERGVYMPIGSFFYL